MMYHKNICYHLQSSEVRRQLIQVNLRKKNGEMRIWNTFIIFLGVGEFRGIYNVDSTYHFCTDIFLQKAIRIHFTLIKTTLALTAMQRISNFLKFQATTMTLAYLLSNEMCTYSATWGTFRETKNDNCCCPLFALNSATDKINTYTNSRS